MMALENWLNYQHSAAVCASMQGKNGMGKELLLTHLEIN